MMKTSWPWCRIGVHCIRAWLLAAFVGDRPVRPDQTKRSPKEGWAQAFCLQKTLSTGRGPQRGQKPEADRDDPELGWPPRHCARRPSAVN